MSNLVDAADANPVKKVPATHVALCGRNLITVLSARLTKGGLNEHLQGRTET